jgi:hypothetical protein
LMMPYFGAPTGMMPFRSRQQRRRSMRRRRH